MPQAAPRPVGDLRLRLGLGRGVVGRLSPRQPRSRRSRRRLGLAGWREQAVCCRRCLVPGRFVGGLRRLGSCPACAGSDDGRRLRGAGRCGFGRRLLLGAALRHQAVAATRLPPSAVAAVAGSRSLGLGFDGAFASIRAAAGRSARSPPSRSDAVAPAPPPDAADASAAGVASAPAGASASRTVARRRQTAVSAADGASARRSALRRRLGSVARPSRAAPRRCGSRVSAASGRGSVRVAASRAGAGEARCRCFGVVASAGRRSVALGASAGCAAPPRRSRRYGPSRQGPPVAAVSAAASSRLRRRRRGFLSGAAGHGRGRLGGFAAVSGAVAAVSCSGCGRRLLRSPPDTRRNPRGRAEPPRRR